MKNTTGALAAFLFLAVLLFFSSMRFFNTTPETVHKIDGDAFLAIEKAAHAFRAHDPDFAKYAISLVREGDSFIVLFAGKEKSADTRGNPGTAPGFEVELNSKTLEVVRSGFIR